VCPFAFVTFDEHDDMSNYVSGCSYLSLLLSLISITRCSMWCHYNTRTHVRLCADVISLVDMQLTLNCEKKFPFDSDVESLRTDAFDDHDNAQMYRELDSHLFILRRIIIRKRNYLT
jgi:hypothetical protein